MGLTVSLNNIKETRNQGKLEQGGRKVIGQLSVAAPRHTFAISNGFPGSLPYYGSHHAQKADS